MFTYKVKVNNSPNLRTVNIDFTPYTNLMGAWNGVTTGWLIQNVESIVVDNVHRIINGGSLYAIVADGFNTASMYKPMTCEVGKKYLVSAYLRNNGVLSTCMRIGSSTAWSNDFYANRVGIVVDSGVATSFNVYVDAYDLASDDRNFWIDGFLMVELQSGDELLSTEALLEKYPYVHDTKDSPSMKDLLLRLFHLSPFAYYLTNDGMRISNYNNPLSEYGVDENSILEVKNNELGAQIFNACLNNVTLMAMLDNRQTRVSHSYPKMGLTNEEQADFPRVQYAMGFEVSAVRADGKSLANNATVAINIYSLTTKFSNCVDDGMISTIMTTIMSTLGFSAIRGSDYNIKQEQLYVRQTQYVKDIHVAQRK